MTDPEPTNDRMGRRTVLKTAAAVGVAGAGLAGTASADEWKTLRFQSTSDDAFEYRVRVSGKLERSPNTDGGDELIDDRTAEGACSRQRDDGWRFKGEIEELELSGPGKVYVGGELVEDTSGEAKDHDDDDDEQHHLRFQSTSDQLFSYRVKVSGTIEREANRDGGDTKIDEHTAEGRARGGNHDDWLFTGTIEDVELDGPGEVLIDGEEVDDPTAYDGDESDDGDGSDGSDGGLPKEVIVSSSIDGYRDYAFAVSGDAQKLEPNEDGVPAKDEIVYENGRTVVRGTVGYGDDRFAFSGEITPIELPDVVSLDVRQR